MGRGGMKSSAAKIAITSYDDLFGLGGVSDLESGGIKEILLYDLHPFKGHPFKVLDDGAMEEMAESIREHGVLVPGIARPHPEGGYELIAGHRRKHASELAGLKAMPVIVREIDDDEAVLMMVDSNIQRENLLPSEKAWAYKMKLDAIRRKAGRPSKDNSGQVVQNLKGENCGQVGHNLKEKRSVEIVAEDMGESRKQVQRYIRLTELVPELLQMVDDKKIAFNPAVELSYLAKDEQGQLLTLMRKRESSLSLDQARRLKKYSQEGKLSADVIDAILTEGKPIAAQVTIKREKLKQYFPETYTQEQMEEIIFSLLETWKIEHA